MWKLGNWCLTFSLQDKYGKMYGKAQKCIAIAFLKAVEIERELNR
jgi:hypothetical protein